MTGSNKDDDEEVLTLSAHALEALQLFKDEETERKLQFEKLSLQAEKDYEDLQQEKPSASMTIDDFKEDWQLSQFWYSDQTADILADALLEGADEDTVICIASAPSVYAAIAKRPRESLPTKHIYLLEFDKRFGILAGSKHFSFYDYKNPTTIPEHLRNKVDRILIDPPFLEKDCQIKSSISARTLLKKDKTSKTKNGDLKYKFISCTGERMQDLIKKIYPDSHITTFFPEHKNGLSNEFRCYASFECESWKFA
ncbi:hypothetical protein PACTADRAFT_47917 [Pachysolen tannophilus NRRL Y-2460]|uniref:Protein-lysine N-methyltransferase EFM5 n=1 Tax=Pachysolen tannophilus NRRL Y-2460 TaxID=669874 RepID=A0A1E4U259_PACTA|nr:hypothetical protein PACTADRAFT_47917 [Pachysolen tannophilus NRRL Y-2460]